MKIAYNLYRVSTKQQVDKTKDDIPMQKIACHDFAQQHGWIIKKEFYEKGISGFKVSAMDFGLFGAVIYPNCLAKSVAQKRDSININ